MRANGETVPSLRMQHVHFDFENAPQYRALSYTWGSRPQNVVLVQDEARPPQEVLVSANLADFLHYATVRSESNENRVYWIDQLSIIQEDYTEKSHRVQMMVSLADYHSTMKYSCLIRGRSLIKLS